MPLPPLEELPLLRPEPPALDDVLLRALAAVEPALRLAVDAAAFEGTEDTLFPTDAALTSPATDADFAVAALTRADASAADLLLAATPPPVPEDCPDTEVRAACRAVLREADCDEATVDGADVLGGGAD
ncbi:MAG: hypothetical protein NVSMB2_04880 [Chloroflexota bacterium]